MTGIELIVREYRHWHLTIAVTGNTLFLVGSVLFFQVFSSWQTLAVWMFVLGSALMLVGAIGEVAKSVYERREKAENRR